MAREEVARAARRVAGCLRLREFWKGTGVAGYLFLATGVLILISGFINRGFVTPAHLLNLMRQAVPLGLVAIGQTLAILSAGVDLSVGSVVILTNILAAAILDGSDANLLPAVGAVLGAAVAVGLFNGLGITRLGINPFVMTLGTGIMVEGVALVYSGGAAKGTASPLIKFLGVGRLWGWLPASVVLWAAMAALVAVILKRTTFGRRIYAVGANRRVALLSGVNVDLVLLAVYVLSAMTAALAGLVVTGYIGTGTLDPGEDYRLTSMAAAVMGGTLFRGGVGGYTGTLASVLTLTVLTSLLTILQVSEPIRRLCYGLIILAVLAITARRG